jgi:hypothetical protein
MIGFTGAALQLHLITTTYNSSQSVTARSISFLDYERLLFHCGWLVNFLAADQLTL